MKDLNLNCADYPGDTLMFSIRPGDGMIMLDAKRGTGDGGSYQGNDIIGNALIVLDEARVDQIITWLCTWKHTK